MKEEPKEPKEPKTPETTPEEEENADRIFKKMVSIINQLVEHHLTMEKEPLTTFVRSAILSHTCPDLELVQAKTMLCIAIAMLVEEREKKK